MTDAELFDSVMKSRGGRLPRTIVSEERWKETYGVIIDWADNLIASAKSLVPGLPHIHFDIVQNESIGAAAFKAEGRYFIAFNTGTRYMLELIFCRMLSDVELFDFVASPVGEDSTLPPLKYSVRAEEMYRAGIWPVRPKTEARWEYTQACLHRAFIFLIGHEIAHITLGHVDYALSKIGKGFVPELGWDLPTEEDKLERQAIEAQADYRSVLSAIESVKLTSEAPMPENPPWIDTRRSVEDLLFDWSFAINTACRIFGDIEVKELELSASSYPPWPLRRFMSVLNAGAIISEAWKPPENKRVPYLNAPRRGAIYTEMAFMKIMGQEYGAKGLYQVFSPLGLEYARKVMMYLHDTLAIKLEPFAYEKPLALQPGESFEEAVKRVQNSKEG